VGVTRASGERKIWQASYRHGGDGRGSASPEIELAESVLTIRQTGGRQEFNLADAAVEVTLHHFATARGTILRVRRGATAVTVAGEEYAAPESPYADEPLDRPFLWLPRPAFETLHRALREVEGRAPPPEQPEPTQSFVLWGNTNRLGGLLPAALVLLVPAVICGAAARLRLPLVVDHPTVAMIPAQVAFFAAIVIWLIAQYRQMKSALLKIAGETCTLTCGRKPVTRRWTRAEADVRVVIWKSPGGRTASCELVPVVEIRVAGALVLATGLFSPYIHARGALRGPAPGYWLDHRWSPRFVACVVPEAIRTAHL
jgi:hypothetical protein